MSTLVGPTGSLGFSSPGLVELVGDGWATWSHGYTGEVLWFGDVGSETSVTINLPTGTKAFYFYAEPDEFATYDMLAVANNGTTSGDETVYGDSGASYFGFYSTDGTSISSVKISSSDDFALGEFGISG